jgi:hypothetical protein
MRPAERLDRRDRVLGKSVDDVVGAQFLRELQRFSSLMSTATTVAPLIFAYWSARWPSPPMPNTATSHPGRAPESFTALYVVTPAHVSTDASRGSAASGTWATKAAFAVAYSA